MLNDIQKLWLAELRAIELRALGCAVCIFAPAELGECDPEAVEERMRDAGIDAIYLLSEDAKEN